MREPLQHQDGERQEMKTGKRFRQSFIVAGQSAKTSDPGEAAFDYSAPWQQYETFPGVGQFDHFQLTPIRGAGWRKVLTHSFGQLPAVLGLDWHHQPAHVLHGLTMRFLTTKEVGEAGMNSYGVVRRPIGSASITTPPA
jgi:hypothetical protein